MTAPNKPTKDSALREKLEALEFKAEWAGDSLESDLLGNHTEIIEQILPLFHQYARVDRQELIARVERQCVCGGYGYMVYENPRRLGEPEQTPCDGELHVILDSIRKGEKDS